MARFPTQNRTPRVHYQFAKEATCSQSHSNELQTDLPGYALPATGEETRARLRTEQEEKVQVCELLTHNETGKLKVHEVSVTHTRTRAVTRTHALQDNRENKRARGGGRGIHTPGQPTARRYRGPSSRMENALGSSDDVTGGAGSSYEMVSTAEEGVVARWSFKRALADANESDSDSDVDFERAVLDKPVSDLDMLAARDRSYSREDI